MIPPRLRADRCKTIDLQPPPPPDAFRIPVEWRQATILLADGSRHEVRLSLGLDGSIRDLFEAQEPFFPVVEAEVFRLYARAVLACVIVDSAEPTQDDGMLPVVRQALLVQLVSGVTIEGVLDIVPIHGRARITDVLNEGAASFVVHHAQGEAHIAKAHVLFIEEHTS